MVVVVRSITTAMLLVRFMAVSISEIPKANVGESKGCLYKHWLRTVIAVHKGALNISEPEIVTLALTSISHAKYSLTYSQLIQFSHT